MTGPLTRQNRYTGRGFVNVGQKSVPGGIEIGFIAVTFCKSCGSVVVLGSVDDHERLHQVKPLP